MSPVIKQDFEAADEEGLEFYRAAGEKLVEARGQIPYGRWSKWLEKNAVEFLINRGTSCADSLVVAGGRTRRRRAS